MLSLGILLNHPLTTTPTMMMQAINSNIKTFSLQTWNFISIGLHICFILFIHDTSMYFPLQNSKMEGKHTQTPRLHHMIMHFLWPYLTTYLQIVFSTILHPVAYPQGKIRFFYFIKKISNLYYNVLKLSWSLGTFLMV